MARSTDRRKSLEKDATRAYVLGSLLLRGSDHPDVAARARRALGWYRDLAAATGATVPFVLVYDLGWLLLDGHAFPFRELSKEGVEGREAEVVRSYQNFFLNALLRTDDTFRRASEAIAADPSRDDLVARAVGLLLRGVAVPDVRLNSAILRSLDVAGRLEPWAEAEAWDAEAGRDHAHLEELDPIIGQLVMRAGARAFGEDDLSEIENWSAYRKAAQRVAGRRIAAVAGSIPPFDPRRIRIAHETGKETEIPDSGTWAEGGYVGIHTKGAPESLVPSELAYLDEDAGLGHGVDLFTVRDAESQLLYYERDQGELQRHRRTIHLAFAPDSGFRAMVRGHPDQLAVAVYGVIVKAAKDLDALFHEDALSLVVHLVPRDPTSAAKVDEDSQLLAVLLRNEADRGIVTVAVEQPGFDLSLLPPDPKSIVYWIAFQFGEDAPAGMPSGARAALEAAPRPPRALIVRVGGPQPPAKKTRFDPAYVWLPLDRNDGSLEPVPLPLLVEDARDLILEKVASASS